MPVWSFDEALAFMSGRDSVVVVVTLLAMAEWALRRLERREGRAGFFLRVSGDMGG